MKKFWITTTETAELLGITDRHVRNTLTNYNYRYREENGKKVLEIEVGSLPREASDKWALRHLPQYEPAQVRVETDREMVIRQRERVDNRTKKHFDKWERILNCTEDITSRRELERWVEWWNKENPSMKTTVGSIYRNRSVVAEQGKLALMNERNTMTSTVRDAWFDDFKRVYLIPTKPSANHARLIALGKAKQRGEVQDGVFPSVSAFTRRLKNEVPKTVICFAREGKKKYNDRNGLYIERDYSNVPPGDVWVGDTHTWDVFVKVNGEITPQTAYITMFTDMCTYLPMGWHLHHTAPSTENTLRALYNGVKKYGAPKILQVDNGREYRNKDYSGQSRGHRIINDEQYAFSMAKNFGIEMKFAIVQNAQTKTIERQFLVIKNSFDKNFHSYKGGNVLEKPEILKKILKRGEHIEWEEFKALADNYLVNIFPALPCDGKLHKGKSRGELWNELIVQRKPLERFSEESLVMIVSRTVTGTVRRNGFRIAALDTWYWAEWMVRYKGETITLRYNPDDMRTAVCYEQNGRLIGNCAMISAVGAMIEDDDVIGKAQIAEGMARRRREEKILKELVPTMPQDQARDFLSAMGSALGTQEIINPVGTIKPTRYDEDAKVLGAEGKVVDLKQFFVPEENPEDEEEIRSLFDADQTALG